MSYSYGGERWSPTPKSNKDILNGFGYPDVIFIGATGSRQYVQEREVLGRVRPAEEGIKTAMERIFNSSKYRELRKIKLGDGRGHSARMRSNTAYLIPVASASGAMNLYSEKNFSLGEILVINLLSELRDVEKGTLVLVDEIELALHSKVQIRLLKYLKSLAKEKDLTVIISTHSASMINAAGRVIYLERDDEGNTVVHPECYPAYALNAIGGQHDAHPDLVILVEDDQALALLYALMNRYFMYANLNPRPEYRLMPVGGAEQVMRFAINCRETLFPDFVKVVCLLDKDMSTNIADLRAKARRSVAEDEQHRRVEKLGGDLGFLPITPEEGMMTFLDDSQDRLQRPVRDLFPGGGTVDLERILADEHATNGSMRPTGTRKIAKQRVEYLIERIASVSNYPQEHVRRLLYGLFVERTYPEAEKGRLLGLLGPFMPRPNPNR
ncbi:MAG TPA: AAA family ATPase [Flavobacteriales bacterium]|nr:AAA family ATPase [Flavobacteriales bacterium]